MSGRVDGVAGGLADWVSLGLLAKSVPREDIDAAVGLCGKQARRAGGKLPPHVMVYFVMALALYAEDDYEEVMARLTGTLASWGCWDEEWKVPTSGGITQARARLGDEVMAELFDTVARPVAGQLTRGAWLGPWRLMSVDGFEWDVPDTPANVREFGYRGAERSAYPKARVVTLTECGSHAAVGAVMGPATGKGTGERSMAPALFGRLDESMLLLADRNFFSFGNWCRAADTGAQLLWRVTSTQHLHTVEEHPEDGSCTSLVFPTSLKRRDSRLKLLQAARRGEDIDPSRARLVRVVEYQIPDRTGTGAGETIRLITTLTRPADAPAPLLAATYHERWEHETANAQTKTRLRGPGRILRSHKPETVRQEIYGYLLTHHAISALICEAATAADIDPDRVKFTRTLRIVRRRVTDSAAFPP
ncbi:IS4 family transposase [Streptomyces sp. NPDC055036]